MIKTTTYEESRHRAECMRTLRTETEQRHAAWTSVLEPAHGCTFSVYIQNPYTQPDAPEAYAADIRVSRPIRDEHGRHIRLDPLVPGDRTRLVFGDDEIYVANYLDKMPYSWERPYHYPVATEAGRPAEGPPSPRAIAPTRLSKWLTDGCFQCMERERLLTDNGTVLLAARSNPIQAPDFGVAMVYATARRALDIWKIYLDWDSGFEAALAKPFIWHFRDRLPRLEIIPAMDEGGVAPKGLASAGYGFIQLGRGQRDRDAHHSAPLANAANVGEAQALVGRPVVEAPSWSIPYWINPDVLVHELGHQLLYATLGFGPQVGTDVSGPAWRDLWGGRGGDHFRAFHEAFSDIVAVVVSMHHRPFIRRLLEETRGDLFSENAATRVGEISARKTIRNTLNNVRLGDVDRASGTGPNDPPENRYYQLSQVLSGALFDVLAGFSVHYLAEYRHLPADLIAEWERAVDPDGRGDAVSVPEAQLTDEVQAIYGLEGGPDIIESAVVRARDALGRLLGGYLAEQAKGGFDPARFSFAAFKRDLVAIASRQDSAPSDALARPTLDGALKARVVEQCLTWRGI
jgi:hypothetical protein